MNNGTQAKRLPVDVHEALQAICSTGKGRCWYCDTKLPKARKAIRDGWDVQRFDAQPVASIILVCPACLERKSGRTAEALRHRRAQVAPAIKTRPRAPRGQARTAPA